MSHAYHDIAFTEAVTALQERAGSRDAYAKQGTRDRNATLGPAEAAFIAARDGFYLGSVSETGWPYIQFRGGPAGFVRVLDETTLGWADFRGNQQFVTAGNVAGDDRVSLFMMDYPNARRLKLYGHLTYRDAADLPDAAAALAVSGYKAQIDRVAIVRVAAFDWNCPQHIPRRFTVAELDALEEAE